MLLSGTFQPFPFQEGSLWLPVTALPPGMQVSSKPGSHWRKELRSWTGILSPSVEPEKCGSLELSTHAVPVLEMSDSPWTPGWLVNQFCSVKYSPCWRQQKVLETTSSLLLSPISTTGRTSCRVSCKLATALHALSSGRTQARMPLTAFSKRTQT